MKKVMCLILVVVAVFGLTGCGDTPQYTLEYWAVDKVLTERYYDVKQTKLYKVEPLQASEINEEAYDEQSFVVLVYYRAGESSRYYDYWLVTVTVKQRCVHSPIDWFRNKKGADALVCKDCIEETQCRLINHILGY